MNKLQLLSIFFSVSILFFGCNKWGTPEFDPNEWDDTGVTAGQYFTIDNPDRDNLKNALWKHRNPDGSWKPTPDSIASVNAIKRYIKAVVVSSDEGGNYYKSMVIQDATGGVELELDMTGLYTQYPVGQKIVLECNGLVVGDYNNLPQIGWIYKENQVGRINSMYISNYIKRDGAPSLSNLPEVLTNDQIDFSSLKDINKLVRLEGVRFEKEAIGKPLAYSEYPTDWIIDVPCNGGTQQVTVRTSNYAKFRNMIIQNKEYNLTGILTIYRNTYQFMIRTRDDIEVTDFFGFDFSEENPLGDGKWSIYPASSKWVYRTQSMAHIGNGTGNAHVDMDDWLISPVIPLQDIGKGSLRIEHQLNVAGGAEYDAYKVYYTTSTSSQFIESEWKELGKLTSFPENFAWSNSLSLADINSNSFRIAFRYLSKNSEKETFQWFIRKVEIRNQ